MMDKIRSAANHLIVKIIFAIIILCFVFTGVGFFGFGGGNSAGDAQQYIAKVDGEGISRAAFENEARQAIANSGSLGNDDSFTRQLRREVFSTQINNYLSYQFSKSLNAYISDEQVKDYIREEKIFFKDGKFSNKKYLELLSNNGYTPDSYAEILRTALQQQQVKSAILDSSFVLPVESELSQLKDQKREVYVTELTPSIVNMDDITITLEDEQKYYDEHQQEFVRKERIKFNSIANLKDNIKKEVTVSDAEIKREYDRNPVDYQFPAKNSYSVIYVTNKDEIDEIAQELKTKNFDELANELNTNELISPYGKNGSLGWFSVDDSLPKPFKEANLTEIGQISSPIAVDNGYLIVKLDAKQPVKKMDYDYAKVLIHQKLTDQKIDKIFDENTAKLQKALSAESNDLKKVAENAGFTMQESDWSYFNSPLTVLKDPEVRDVAFGNDMLVDGKATGKISEIIPIGKDQIDGGIIIQVIDYRPEGVAPFEEVQDQIHKKLYDAVAQQRFQGAINNIMQELKETEKSKDVTFASRYTLTRDSKEFDSKVIDMIFNIVPSVNSKPAFGVTFVDNKSAYVVALINVKPADEVKDISAELLKTVTESSYYSLLVDLRSKAKIEIMPNANL